MKTERKGKSRQFKLPIWKTLNGNDAQSYSRNPTHSAVETKFKNEMTDAYVNSSAVSRTNAELDKHNKDSKKVNPVPENQPESSERQPADREELRASLTIVKTGFNPPILTALAENNVDANDVVERDYRDKETTTGTEVEETIRIKEEKDR